MKLLLSIIGNKMIMDNLIFHATNYFGLCILASEGSPRQNIDDSSKDLLIVKVRITK